MSEQSDILPQNTEETQKSTKETKTVTPIPNGMLKSGRVWKKNQTKKQELMTKLLYKVFSICYKWCCSYKDKLGIKAREENKRTKNKRITKEYEGSKSRSTTCILLSFLIY